MKVSESKTGEIMTPVVSSPNSAELSELGLLLTIISGLTSQSMPLEDTRLPYLFPSSGRKDSS